MNGHVNGHVLNGALDRPHPTLRALEEDGIAFYSRRDPGFSQGTGQLDPHGYHAHKKLQSHTKSYKVTKSHKKSQKVTKRLIVSRTDPSVKGLHDDSYLLGPPAALKEALERLQPLMTEAGLALQRLESSPRKVTKSYKGGRAQIQRWVSPQKSYKVTKSYKVVTRSYKKLQEVTKSYKGA